MKHLVTGQSKSKSSKGTKNVLAEYATTITFFNNDAYT
jgi:hypothetical protein